MALTNAFHMVGAFSRLVLLIFFLKGCMMNKSTWSKSDFKLLKGDIQGQIPSGGFLDESIVGNKIDCAIKCTENQNCAAMFYLRDIKACKIHDQKMSDLATGLVSYPAAVYYELVEQQPLTEENSCPADDSVFRTGETSDGTRFQFRLFTDSPRSYSEAQQNCEAHGAKLYKVLTPEKMAFTLQLMACPAYNSSSFWINGVYASGTWQTMDGEPIVMTSVFWAPERPNENESAPCLWISDMFSYYFDDRDCDVQYYSICEK